MSEPEAVEPAEPTANDFVKLLDYLKSSRGFDFSGYKLASLIRRVRKRMEQVGIESYADYIDYLEVHQDEFAPLFNTILINVTSFFRDPAAWETLAGQVVPRLLESKAPEEPVRCWSAGCASGEEAYTLAMVLAEAMGEQQLRQRVKIYATDADEEALAQARRGSYTEAQVQGVPPELLAKYFDSHGERWIFRPELRRSLIFGRHDLVQDAAISRIDLLVCRNALMYFNADTQAKILARFHFALQRNGYVFLGKAETLLSHNSSFRPESLKARIFQRAPSSSMRDRMLAFSPAASPGEALASRNLRIRDAALDAGPVAQIAFDRKGHLTLANEPARLLFGLKQADLGRLLQDLEISCRPVELRSHVEAVCASRTPLTLKEVAWRGPEGEERVVEVRIVPLTDGKAGLLGTGVSFVDLTVPNRLRDELEKAGQELETANEELQSANEELETTNEELQSANEELETMNEELQSTNEELRNMNDQLQERSEELGHLNGHLRSILGNLRAAVVVLNPDLSVEIWSDKAQELWGLRSEEVQGRRFFDLDIGLPVDELRQPISRCLDSGPAGAEMRLDGINRRGRTIRCQIVCTRFGESPRPSGVILLMEEVSAATEVPAGS